MRCPTCQAEMGAVPGSWPTRWCGECGTLSALGVVSVPAQATSHGRLRAALSGIHDMAEDELRHRAQPSGSNVYQIEADARAALALDAEE